MRRRGVASGDRLRTCRPMPAMLADFHFQAAVGGAQASREHVGVPLMDALQGAPHAGEIAPFGRLGAVDRQGFAQGDATGQHRSQGVGHDSQRARNQIDAERQAYHAEADPPDRRGTARRLFLAHAGSISANARGGSSPPRRPLAWLSGVGGTRATLSENICHPNRTRRSRRTIFRQRTNEPAFGVLPVVAVVTHEVVLWLSAAEAIDKAFPRHSAGGADALRTFCSAIKVSLAWQDAYLTTSAAQHRPVHAQAPTAHQRALQRGGARRWSGLRADASRTGRIVAPFR